ncbi:MAG: site-2 protease family protein [Planctomycetota bacterium]|nr:site-2 protease family protein [Planctomycetota bacterium]
MNRTYIHLGRAFGIPVRLHWTVPYFLLGVAVFSGASMALALAVVLVIVLAHEFGHSLVAQRLGIEVTQISILPIGGMAHMAILPERASEELRIAVAGPAVNLVLAIPGLVVLIAAGQLDWPDALIEGSLMGLLFWFTAVNLALGLFNLLPAFPMDGGRILRALLVKRFGYLRATEVAARVGRWLAFGMALVAIFSPSGTIGLLFVAGFVWIMGGRELFMVRLRHASQGSPGGQGDPREALFRMFRGFPAGQAGPGAFGPEPPRDPFADDDQQAAPKPPGQIEILAAPAKPKRGFTDADIERLERFPGRLPKDED